MVNASIIACLTMKLLLEIFLLKSSALIRLFGRIVLKFKLLLETHVLTFERLCLILFSV